MEKIKVEALETYSKYELKDVELNRIPNIGEVFEVSKERLKVLLGNNKYNLVFVKEVKTPSKESD